MPVHTIRLREPWEAISVPGGGVRFCRRFGAPTGLTAAERVWLVAEALPRGCGLWLNDQILEPSEQARWDITEKLRPRNQVCIEAAGGESSFASGRPGEVRLEIGEIPAHG